MKQFNMSGVIGWDVIPSDVREFLKDAAGDDIEVIVASPGGLVAQGLEIFNMIRNYPGHTTAILSGYAMSMASYIPLAADKIVAEDNAVFMIHNVHGGVFGDHNYILKYGRETEALSKLLASAYVRHTGKSVDEIAKMMDEETYFYGSEIVDEGFAAELLTTEDGGDQENQLAAARIAFVDCGKKIASDSVAAADDLIMAVALAKAKNNLQITNRAEKPATTNKEQDIMDLTQLKEKHPDLVAALAQETISGLTREALEDGNPDLFEYVLGAGAGTETARIKDVRAQLIPGHEKLVEKMELDGKSTGADAAMAIVQAEKNLRKAADNAMDDESNNAVPPAGGDDNGKKMMKRADYDALPIDEQRAYLAEGGTVTD